MFLPASQPKGSSEDLLFARPCPLCSVMGLDSPHSRIATYGWWRMRSSVGSLPFRRARHRAPRSSRTAGIVSSTIVRRPDRSDSTDHFDPRPGAPASRKSRIRVYATIRSIPANARRAFASLRFTLRTKSSEMGNNPR
jgi:hypothetical protein